MNDLEYILNKPMATASMEKEEDVPNSPGKRKVENPDDYKKYIKELVYSLDILEVYNLLKYERSMIELRGHISINKYDSICFYHNHYEQQIYIEGIFNYTLELLKNRMDSEFNDGILLNEFIGALPDEVVKSVNRHNMLERI